MSPPPPWSDVFCPPDHDIVFDANVGDKCVGSGPASNWSVPSGCADSLYLVGSPGSYLNSPDVEPRVLLNPCWTAAGHSSAWGGHVEQCLVETVTTGISRSNHARTVLYNARTGAEMSVARILNWGHVGRYLFILTVQPANSSYTLNNIFDNSCAEAGHSM